MRKFLSLIVAVMMIAAIFAISASAESIIFGGEHCNISVEVKKADSSAVVKDGIISENEYERADISVSDDDTMLGIGFGSPEMYVPGAEMLKTLEYYFSWDEIHGFNFAVKFKPHVIMQEFEQPERYYLESEDVWFEGGDDFLNQTGIHISVGEELRLYELLKSNEEFDHGIIYRWAVAKRTTDGQYISGYPTKGGLIADTPVPGEDYIIEYTDDGYVICEYSIDFAEIKPDARAGDELYISIGVTGGTSTPDTLHSNSYSVNLGEYTYYMLRDKEAQNGRFVLTDAQIPNNEATTAPVTTAPETTAPDAPVVTDAPVTTTPATSTVVSEEVKVTDTDGNVATDDEGNDITTIITSIVTDAPTQDNADDDVTSPVTGDPMIFAAVAAALSACGVVVSKKRK